ncbi:hypothetical protein M407DRAFT_17500 [Tulasnella calospora MUT 4182]|uniref:Uncharacterized protein n=1 Tax=Tulasnella calospora MUT 4182 TaxID=1051891 RepID=A0A0C3QVD9_9AGAM|nr:hypothetical protein M407DRAFT_17500 [Tulasnella calospora MUT 4182]
MSYSAQDFDGMTQDDPQPQLPQSGLPDINTLSPVQVEEEASAASTHPTTFSAATSPDLATPNSVSTAPTSTVTSSLHSLAPRPDLLAVNQRIAELEGIAKQIEQEYADHLKEAREMDATLTSLGKEVDSAIEAIKSVNREMALEAEEWAEDDLFRAKHNYEEGQKKYVDLQVRYANLQRERERLRIGMNDAGPLPPNEPWLEVLSTAVSPNLLAVIAFGIGHILGPLLPNAF